ncbi:hypothetical protein ABID59_004400 [Bradyrhizobium sp. S3.3.6]
MQFWGMGTGTLMRDIVRDYVEHLADDDAVLVIDETGLLKQDKSVMQSGAANTLVWQARFELPDRSLPKLRVMVIRSWTARCIFKEGPMIRSSVIGRALRKFASESKNGSPRLPQAAEVSFGLQYLQTMT